MDREPVTSSDIVSIGYDNKSSILEIEFHKNNSIYRYYDVPKFEHVGIMNAPSHGKYLNQNIKGKYEYKKIS